MIQALLFDINGTVTDILTDESRPEIYRTLSNFLDYRGIKIPPEVIQTRYFELIRHQKEHSLENYPEFDAIRVFYDLLVEHGHHGEANLLAPILSDLFRAVSRLKLEPYPGVRELLPELEKNYQLAAVSDGQVSWTLAELRSIGIIQYFHPVVISGDYGFRKPDRRMFGMALMDLNLPAESAVFIGNDTHRDIYGAHQTGMRTIFFESNQGDHAPHGADPDYVIHDFRELPQALARLNC